MKYMEESILHSQPWLELMKDGFESWLAEGSYINCMGIIEQLKDEGFEVEAKTLHNQLLEEKALNFN